MLAFSDLPIIPPGSRAQPWLKVAQPSAGLISAIVLRSRSQGQNDALQPAIDFLVDLLACDSHERAGQLDDQFLELACLRAKRERAARTRGAERPAWKL